MNTREMAERMVTRLGESFGRPDLKLNADGSVLTKIDGFTLRLDYDQGLGALLASVFAGRLSKSQEPLEVLAAAMRANLMWDGSAGGTFGLKDGELTLAAMIDLDGSFPEADADPPDDFLLHWLPRLCGAAAATLEMCGERPY
jgi:hypothetical protein